MATAPLVHLSGATATHKPQPYVPVDLPLVTGCPCILRGKPRHHVQTCSLTSPLNHAPASRRGTDRNSASPNRILLRPPSPLHLTRPHRAALCPSSTTQPPAPSVTVLQGQAAGTIQSLRPGTTSAEQALLEALIDSEHSLRSATVSIPLRGCSQYICTYICTRRRYGTHK